MDLPSFLIGVVVAWIVALLIYWFQSQRERENDATLISYSDHLAGLQRSEERAAHLQIELQTAQNACVEQTTAMQQQIDDLNAQVEQLNLQLEEVSRPVASEYEEPVLDEPVVDDPLAENPPMTQAAVEAAAPAEAAPAPTRDDLKRIEGIGPKIESLLNDAAIHTFAQLAAADVDRLQQILAGAGDRYRMANPHSWPQQAQLAADGQWDELQALQDQLQGGRQE